jgi:hypothetical protein
VLVAGARRREAWAVLTTDAASSSGFEARQAQGALLYEHTDIPEGMTIAQWRRSQAATVVMSDHRRVLRRRPRTMLPDTVA